MTVTDLDPTSVANMAAGDLGTHARATTRVVDATNIEAPDDSYDLVVFAAAFHHLPPATAVSAISEATRVGKRFLVVDLIRLPTVGLALIPIVMLPVMLLPARRAILHDGTISMLRSYSATAFTALGQAADPAMNIRLVPSKSRLFPSMAVVVYSR